MAVVKASFTKTKGGAKASVRYIMFRPGRDGEKIERQLFGHDGTLSLFQADTMIDEAEKGTVFFRIVISPDPLIEDKYKDLNLWELTQLTVLKLEDCLKKEIQFFAAEHNDHTPNRHIHMMALISGKLGIAELELLRKTATDIALFQRQERELALAQTQGRGAEASPVRPVARQPQPQRQINELPSSRGASAKPLRPEYRACHLCGKPVGKNYTKCYNCGARLAISLDLGDNGLGNEWDF